MNQEEIKKLTGLLFRSITEAISSGTQHYDKAGNLLKTPTQVLACMLSEGGVTYVHHLKEEKAYQS